MDLSAVTGVTQDSRRVKKGFLFAAIKGAEYDGHDYIDHAIKAGASAVLAEYNVDIPDGVDLHVSENIRRDLAKIAAKIYGPFPENIVAVTGTNGKSSVVHFVQQIWQAQGFKAESIGTLSGGLTSPDPVTLAQNLADLSKEGVTHVALEASSHGLDQYRLDGVDISAAGFTNLSRDHLDYHGDMSSYLAAKSRLFSDCVTHQSLVVLNADIAEFPILQGKTSAPIVSYGRQGRAIKLVNMQAVDGGYSVSLEVFGQAYQVTVPLVGEFQIYNALCALGLSLLTDAPAASLVEKSVRALSGLKAAKGRLQPILGHPSVAQIYVDYAHTPDALETVLKALRKHTENDLYCVFGCGGDRDNGKRPAMGKIASDLSDVVIITDDNPRNEKPVDIRKQILSGIQEMKHNDTVFEIGDRAAAINHSIKKLKKGDVLVIAGKGHESGQIVAGKNYPFDDYKEAAKAVEGL